MAKRRPKRVYPWEGLPKGRAFFIPTLAVEEVRIAGLKAATQARLKRRPEAVIGIYKGQLGVLFIHPKY